MLRLGLFILVLIAGIQSLFAQRNNFKFYGEDEGLNNLSVHTVLQDHRGFLWVGTQNGLYRYDGVSFLAFGKAEGLPSDRVEAVGCHQQGWHRAKRPHQDPHGERRLQMRS